MKIVVKNNDLYIKMEEAINMLCDTVKMTLGPKGANVIINKSTFSPFITNDGVTIAENIESDDIVINTILEIAKESSIKTNEMVGDGTTTTLVLLQSIFNGGLSLIKNGMNPMVLKKELDKSLEKVIALIKKEARSPLDEELQNIAKVSSNDEKIGNIISEAYLKIRNREGILIREGNNLETKINYLEGYIFESNLASGYFLKELNEIILDDVYVLLIDEYIEDIESLSKVINYVVLNNKSLVILAKDYDEYVINHIVSLNLDNEFKIYLLRNPEYGNKQISILKDISSITNSKIINKLNNIDTTHMGLANKIRINDKFIIINFKNSKIVDDRIKELKKEIVLGSDNTEINKRISMFTNGMAEIVVGDKTTTERREKRMRYEDALCAITSASLGVVPGGGITFLKISNKLKDDCEVHELIINALKEPFNQILLNAGINKNEILKIVEENNYDVIFNLNNLKFENFLNTKILDAKDVLINAIIAAVSIASMLLSTNSIVINEHENNFNKLNEYNEL